MILTWGILTLRSAVGEVLNAPIALARLSAHTWVDPNLAAKQLLTIDGVHGLAGLVRRLKINKGVGGVAISEGIDAHADASKIEAIGSEQVLDILA